MQAGLYEYEMALLANLVPQELEEAFALVPSLRVSGWTFGYTYLERRVMLA
jgi:hypothetical protein